MRKSLLLILGFACCAAAQNIIQLPDSLWATGDTVAWVKKIPGYCEGPAWDAATGNVYFDLQIGNNTPNWPVWRVKPGVDTGIIFINTYQNNGLDFDPQGRLIASQNGRISRYKNDGTLDSTLATFATSIQVNDLSIGSNGAMYFTALSGTVYYLSPTRQMSTAATGLTQANGIEFLEDENNAYVNETGANRVRRFPITTAGVLGTGAAFITSPSPDGGTIDSHGNRYVASYGQGEVRVFNARGDSIGRIAMRVQSGIYDWVKSSSRVGIAGNVDNCVFGGADMKTLFISGDGGLFSIRLKVAGRSRYATTGIKAGKFWLSPMKKTVPGIFPDARGREVFWPANRKVIPVLHVR